MAENKECTQALLALSQSLLRLADGSREQIIKGGLQDTAIKSHQYVVAEAHRLIQWVAYKSREVYVHGAANIQLGLIKETKGCLEYYSKNQDHPVEWRGNTIFTEKLEDLLKVVES